MQILRSECNINQVEFTLVVLVVIPSNFMEEISPNPEALCTVYQTLLISKKYTVKMTKNDLTITVLTLANWIA